MVFDLLVDAKEKSLTALPLSARRMALQEFASQYLSAQSVHAKPVNAKSTKAQSKRADSSKATARILLSPASSDFTMAEKWMREGAASGWDGVVAKRLNCEYTSGERTGMVKIKRIRTADCVVGGFRWARKGGEVGSLLLGLYNNRGQLDHIGFSSAFTREDRKKLKSVLKPLIVKDATQGGFTGKAPGGPSRWTRDDRDTEWVPLKPKLVGEFQYDHFSGHRFRHGTKFLRWRPEKKPNQCTMEQVTHHKLKAKITPPAQKE
jgi:ATP-dependent DNA ligase